MPAASTASTCTVPPLPQSQERGRALKSQAGHHATLAEDTLSRAHVKPAPVALCTTSKWTEFRETALIYDGFLEKAIEQGCIHLTPQHTLNVYMCR